MRIKVSVDGHIIQIKDGPYTQDDSATEAAIEFAKHLISQLPAMKKYAAENLMSAYDSLWPEDEHEALTISEFETRLTAPEIFIQDTIGAAAVYFDDDGMFRNDFLLSIAIANSKITDVSLE